MKRCRVRRVPDAESYDENDLRVVDTQQRNVRERPHVPLVVAPGRGHRVSVRQQPPLIRGEVCLQRGPIHVAARNLEENFGFRERC